MRLPKVTTRRPYWEEDRKLMRDGKPHYVESDTDFVANNLKACVWFLENRDRLKAALTEASHK